MCLYPRFFILFLLSITCSHLEAQSVTGIWRGKLKGISAEVKLIKNGDQLVGVAYYYKNKNSFQRYGIRGHFDPETNEVIWWDEVLLPGISGPGAAQAGPDPQAQLMVADFNCPGAEEMFLDGNSSARDNREKNYGLAHLEKKEQPIFPDEWDDIILNYFSGANDPELIDSMSRYGVNSNIPEEIMPIPQAPSTEITASVPDNTPPSINATPLSTPAPEDRILDKFKTRNNVLQTVIPVTGASVEIRFYDNAQVDGDSISLFLNGQLIQKNIRLTDQAFTIHLKAADLSADNELVMVAENLGSIPPNTASMVAVSGDKRQEARLYANEKSSALIRLVKPQ